METSGKIRELEPPNLRQQRGNHTGKTRFPFVSSRLKSSREKNGSALCLKTSRAAHRLETFRAWKAGCRLIDHPAIHLSGFIRAVAEREIWGQTYKSPKFMRYIRNLGDLYV